MSMQAMESSNRTRGNVQSRSFPSSMQSASREGICDLSGWKFVQSFGDDSSSADDLITCVEFDCAGTCVAVGDKAGRVCIFVANETDGPEQSSSPTQRGSLSSLNNGRGNGEGKESLREEEQSSRAPLEYVFFTEFQSHEPEFDCLKSLEIQEKINMVQWCRASADGLFLLATNDKTVKFWKVHERRIKSAQEKSKEQAQDGTQNSLRTGRLTLPDLSVSESVTTASLKRVFNRAHGFHINSVSMNADGESFISADDLIVNLWDLEVSDECYTIIDCRPGDMDDLSEVITSASCDPSSCNNIIFASSRGVLSLVDLRVKSQITSTVAPLSSAGVLELDCTSHTSTQSFFGEIIRNVSDAQFSHDGRLVVSRDYLSMKVWDVRQSKMPVSVVPVNDYLALNLCDLYENDCMFDKFGCCASPEGTRFLTGGYDNSFSIYDYTTNRCIWIRAFEDAPSIDWRLSRPGDVEDIDDEADSARTHSAVDMDVKDYLEAKLKDGSSSGSGTNAVELRQKEPQTASSSSQKQITRVNNSSDYVAVSSFLSDNVRIPPSLQDNMVLEEMDFGKKTLHVAWHPEKDVIAVAGLNKLYVYQP